MQWRLSGLPSGGIWTGRRTGSPRRRAVEVKAASTVRAEDFRGLRHLAERLGDDLVLGVVLYTGGATLPFGPKLRAMPVSALWQLDTTGEPHPG